MLGITVLETLIYIFEPNLSVFVLYIIIVTVFSVVYFSTNFLSFKNQIIFISLHFFVSTFLHSGVIKDLTYFPVEHI